MVNNQDEGFRKALESAEARAAMTDDQRTIADLRQELADRCVIDWPSIVDDLLAWHDHTGGWEGPAWKRAKAAWAQHTGIPLEPDEDDNAGPCPIIGDNHYA